MASNTQGLRDNLELHEMLTDEDRARGYNEQLRLMVLGADEDLMDKACATILGERENRDTFQFGELKPREAQVCGRQVTVLKTPSYWLGHLKSSLIFSNGVKTLTYELKFFESQMFPGAHAFLLVHRDVKKTGKENYLLRALSSVFGETVLDYCMVLFIDEARQNDPKKNYCLMMCGGRHHILQNTEESVHQLFKKTKTMTKCKRICFFLNQFDYFQKAKTYFEAEYEEKINKLSRELKENNEIAENLKKEINDVKELNAKKVQELSKRFEDDQKKLSWSKDKEDQLHNELYALKSRENQTKEDSQKLKEELLFYKTRENELRNELDAVKSRENQTKEDSQKLKEELIFYKNRENELSNEVDTLKSSKKQAKKDSQKLKEELIIYKKRENELNDELNALKSSKKQTNMDFKKLNEELIICKERENLLLRELDALRSENKMMEDFQKLKGELIIYKERERQLKDDKEKLQRDKEKLQREVEQLKDNRKTTK